MVTSGIVYYCMECDMEAPFFEWFCFLCGAHSPFGDWYDLDISEEEFDIEHRNNVEIIDTSFYEKKYAERNK